MASSAGTALAPSMASFNAIGSRWCGDQIENSFGPTVRACRGGFDFTVFFEQLFLAILPSAVFLCAVPIRAHVLYRQGPKAHGGWMLPLKAATTAVYTALQLYLLTQWATAPPFAVRTGTAAAALFVADGCAMLVLSPLEHLRSVRPSTLLQVYLFFTLLFDIVQVRTLWLVGQGASVVWVSTIAAVVKGVLCCLETVEKRRLLLAKYHGQQSEAVGSFVNRSFFWWLNELLVRGYRKNLMLADINDLEESYRAASLEHSLRANWATADRQAPHALIWSLAWTLRRSLAATVFPRLCLIGFKFSQPFLISSLIKYLNSAQENPSVGHGLIGAFVLVYCGVALSTGFYWYKAYRTITMIRGSLIAMIYAKTLELNLDITSNSSPTTLMSTDVERICTCIVNLHELWANMIEIGLSVYILEIQIGGACIATALLAIFCGLGTLLLTKPVGKRQETWLKAVQKRLKVTEETISSHKSIKMMGLAKQLQQLIDELRIAELVRAMDYRKLQVTSIILSLVMSVLGPATTITTFTAISAVRGAVTLLPSQAFASIAVLALLGTPLITLFQGLPLIRSAIGSMERIQDFLNQDCRPDCREASEPLERPVTREMRSGDENGLVELAPSAMPSHRSANSLVSMSDVSVGWGTDSKEILQKINLDIKPGTLTAIIGPVGCGKSTLLKAALGETKLLGGQIAVNCRSIAFSDQTPWLVFGTVKQNITGMTAGVVDEKWYQTILQACDLAKDLDQLPHGDATMIGSKGTALSGGQRQRLSLARVLYSRARLAIFDSVFTGLDRNTEAQVFARVFGPDGLLRKQGVTAILVTNNSQHLQSCSQIVALNEAGQVIQQGQYEMLVQEEGYVKSLVDSASMEIDTVDIVPEEAQSTVQRTRVAAQRENAAADIERRMGDISLYRYYLKHAGYGTFVLAVSILAVYSFCLVFPTLWLDWWSTANEKRPGQNLAMYLGVYIFLGVLGLAALGVFCWQMIVVLGPTAGQKLHSILLVHVLRAPLSFLTSADMGSILNHFSQDMQLIDFQVTLTSMSAAEALSTTIFRLVIVCATAKYVATIMPLSVFAVYVIQKGYLRTSRQLRYLDLEAKAPIYTQFVETLDGLATIRAFGWQDAFRTHGYRLLDEAQRPFYLLNCIQRWLGFVLDMLLAAVSVLVVVFAVKLSNQSNGGSTGVALVNILSCHQNLAGFVLRWTLLETSIGAVSRIRAFAMQCPSEDRAAAIHPPPNWPATGSVEIRDISASYRPGAPILRNVSCSIPSGSKVGVCGRTGSGKSSFVLCLLQMLDLSSGQITIDGVDLALLSPDDARSAFICVPQDAVVFDGSVRFNLDPGGHVDDASLEVALRKVHLWSLLNAFHASLDSPIDDLHLSHGQKQLFSLARAMLSKSRILILDEATSSVDHDTNQMMQALVRSEFSHCTVICVDHHVENILDYDTVALFDNGSLAEFDRPGVLLQTDSKFKKLVDGRHS